MKKLILFTCLLFFQSLLPSDFGLHRAQLGKALLVTAGTAAAGLGAYHLNKRGEERYKAACTTVDASQEISTGWRIARNLLTVLSGADKANQGYAHSWLPHKKFWGYLAQKTGLDHIINKDMPPPISQCIGWEAHMPLLALLTEKEKNREKINPLINNLPELNDRDRIIDNLPELNDRDRKDLFYLPSWFKILLSQNTTAYYSELFKPDIPNILVIYEKQLHKFTFNYPPLPCCYIILERYNIIEKDLNRRALKSIYQHLFLQRKEAIKTLCLLRNKEGSPVVPVFPEALQIIAEYL